jgi:rhodanese-related sulfurtransferase
MIGLAKLSGTNSGKPLVCSSRPRGAPRTRTSLAVTAIFKGSQKEKDQSSTQSRQKVDKELEKMMGGFIWDGSMQRWRRAKNRDVDPAQLTVTPKSGMPYTVWPVMHTYLTQKKLKSCTIEQAQADSKKRNTILMDVRLAVDFEKQHAQGAQNVPLFRITAGDSKWDNIKRVVMAGLNMKATERDPDFIKNVDALTGGRKGTKIIVMCSIGGTLDTVVKVKSTGKSTATDVDRTYGRESRSLKACYELMRAGYRNVVHMEGGLGEWRYNGLPLEEN